jgi:hypothetical protein
LSDPTKPADPSPSLPGRWAAAFSVKRVAVVAPLCVLAAAALSPIFVSPFTLLLGRTLFVGMVLLIAFSAVGEWRQPWLPRWLAQVLAVGLAVGLATFAVYLLSVDGDVIALLRNEGRITGVISISVPSLVVAPGDGARRAVPRARRAGARGQPAVRAREKLP